MKSFIRQKKKIINKPISKSSVLMSSLEKWHIKAHLSLTELRLRLSKNKSHNRLKTLNNLNNYHKNGVFPMNTSIENVRTPVFIDENGTYCAVGALMANSGHEALANTINSQNPFILVEELDSPQVENWLYQAGLTQEEAALIQPSYGFTLERVSYTAEDKIKAVASIVCCIGAVLLLGFIIYVLKNRNKVKKPALKLKLSMASLLALILCLVFLPSPSLSMGILKGDEASGEEIYCRSMAGPTAMWNSNSGYDNICKNYDFKDSSKTPGWRFQPCDSIC